MSASGWVAIGCWAMVVILIVVGWRVGRRRRRRAAEAAPRPVERERLDFREWLDDWDRSWR